MEKDFIEFMLDSGVLKFGEFTTKSGRLSPYFINTGLYNTGKKLFKLGGYYADTLYQAVKDNDGYDALFGPAYKGIPLAAMTAAVLSSKYGIDKGYFFNRKEAKDHGEGGSFVGYVPAPGKKAVIIEDVITAGTAVREVMPLLDALGIKVSDMIISVNRAEKGANGTKSAVSEIFEEFGIRVHSIVNVYDIYEYMKNSEAYAKYASLMESYMDRYCEKL